MKICLEHANEMLDILDCNGKTVSNFKKCPICFAPIAEQPSHIRSWYIENWKVDPVELDIRPKISDNPHFKKAAKMKTYFEFMVEKEVTCDCMPTKKS